MVGSIKKCVSTLAENIASAIPCIIEGPVGCGKTSLVEYLACITGHSSETLTKVQMGDQVDSKSLIGNYHCSEIPGEFVWRPGPLTDCMVRGSWLLIEDIDAASPDVISTIVSALKSRQLSSLPGCNVSGHINGDFRIFFTRRLDRTTSAASEIDSVATKITIESLKSDDLRQMLLQLYPSMKNLFTSILNTYELAKNFESETSSPFSQFSSKPLTNRSVSLRDLLKWVKRIHAYHVNNLENLAALVFADAVDCFIPDPIFQMNKVQVLGTHLNLSKQQATSLCFSNPCEPSMIGSDMMSVGRAQLKRAPLDRLTSYCLTRNSSFALTVPTLLLMERIAASLSHDEPVLLVGETGCGKTSVVQYLADRLGRQLTVVNLNQQSDSADLIGGYKPVDISFLMDPIRLTFQTLIKESFAKNNDVFLGKVNQCFSARRYKDLVQLVCNVAQKVLSMNTRSEELKSQWKRLVHRAETLVSRFCDDNRQAMLAFAFVEGSLVKCVREGSWILLDEINLAEAETLHSLSALLDSAAGDKVILVDKADGQPILRHPEFRVFACMNPATDVGKRDLPLGIRHRFTEFYVDEITQRNDLNLLVAKYLPSYGQPNKLVDLYLAAKELATTSLVDSTGHRPHYSLRTLCRALAVASNNPCKDVSRSLYESFSMSFLTQLSSKSKELMTDIIVSCILGDTKKAVLSKPILKTPDENSIQLEGFWIPIGTEKPVQHDNRYIFTDCIHKNLKDLARAVSIGKKFPILIQGETSVGKTSLINWLARASGNVCRRVNNHEHTDLEEYIGSYVTDESGNLVFREGILVEAMRKGYWIILDELNLAPTEILEALNRLLDDNRELFIAETRTLVKAHPSFLLFATQNPPGLYGGRKMLSRAFRNRFIELHFEEIPKDELADILEKRCSLPKSHACKMVRVMSDLQKKRRSSHIFAGKSGFITLRDLFRWGDRHVKSSELIQDSFYDWDMHLASTGYMLLAGKVRTEEETHLVRQVLESHFLRKKQTLDPIKLIDDQFSALMNNIRFTNNNFSHLVATPSFKRLVVLLWNAFTYKEPVLLVGQTGCGKTTACQLYSESNNHPMSIINCHMNSDGSDFLGSLRPVRDHSCSDESSNKLFEWVDGPLVKAIKNGHIFLMDEISLADDSVLERLNSLLEPERTIFLAEKSGADHQDALYVAHDSFLLAATMNPGDDFGKKELSPALRNRFTEIWCSNLTTQDEFKQVILQNLGDHLKSHSLFIATAMTRFYFWFQDNLVRGKSISFRDILSWIEFINTVTRDDENRFSIDAANALLQGAHLVLLDALGCDGSSVSSTGDLSTSSDALPVALSELKQIICHEFAISVGNDSWILKNDCKVLKNNLTFGMHPFFIECATGNSCLISHDYSFNSLGVSKNCFKLLRAMQLKKPILLEGSPGVGKTSLVNALARVTGHKVVRINLSEQSDISDLFGSDLPIEGDDTAGKFEWRDGPLLIALRSPNTWIMLDELNLAPQSVLEGLNSCLDHRGEIFIPELGKSFTVNKQTTRIFATQNPQSQGGDRRGLPRSFLNRFTNVYISSFTESDLITVAEDTFPSVDVNSLNLLVRFNQQIVDACQKRLIGLSGSPFEFNFRDISRVCHLLTKSYPLQYAIEMIYVNRFRSSDERKIVRETFENIFNVSWIDLPANILVTPESVSLPFIASVPRKSLCPRTVSHENTQVYDFSPMRSLLTCIDMNWLTLFVAPKNINSARIAEKLAILTGNFLKVFSVHPELDALELLGGFEKKNIRRQIDLIHQIVHDRAVHCIRDSYLADKKQSCKTLWKKDIDFHLSTPDIPNEGSKFSTIIIDPDKIHGSCCSSSSSADTVEDKSLEALVTSVNKLSEIPLTGSFEWVDSQIVAAARDGHWLLIDGANLCAASVLDRLNSLFEPDGFLLLSEKGSDSHSDLQTVKPHPNFRVIMSVDPARGEMSRAMRNRAVEVFIDPSLLPSLQSVDVSFLAADPLGARVAQFNLSQRIGSNSINNCLVANIFLERSSPADLCLRLILLEKFLKINSPDVSPPSFHSGSEYEPFDRRTLFSPNQLPVTNDSLNLWHLSNFVKLSQSLDIHGLINSPLSRLLSDPNGQINEDQLYLLRLYGLVRATDASDLITSQLSRRLSSRLQELCSYLVKTEDVFDCHAAAWENLLLKCTVSTSLVHSSTSGDAVSRLIDLFYIYRSNIVKYHEPLQDQFVQVTQKLLDRSPLVTSLVQQLTQVVSSSISGSLDNQSASLTHHEASVFSTLLALMHERRGIDEASIHLSNNSLHPLRTVFTGKSSLFTSERLLYHLLDSRLFCDYCHKLALLPKSQEHSSILTFLLCRISTSNSFQLRNVSQRIQLLQDVSQCLMKNFSFLTAKRYSGNFDHGNDILLRKWLQQLILYETRDQMKLSLNQLRQSDLSNIHSQIQLGLITCSIFLPVSLCDPSELKHYELDHLKVNLSMIDSEIAIRKNVACQELGQNYQPNTPLFLTSLCKSRQHVVEQIDQVSCSIVYRMSPRYDALRQQIMRFNESVLDPCREDIKSSQLPKHVAENYARSCASFATSLLKDFVDYYDIINPFVTGLLITAHALEKVHNNSEKHCSSLDSLTNLFALNCNSFDQLKDKLLFKLISESIDGPSIKSNITINLLSELHLEMSSNKCDKVSTVTRANQLLQEFVESWHAMKAHEKALKEAEDALVHYKTHEAALDDDEIDAKTLAQMFPSFTSVFSDITDEHVDDDVEEMKRTEPSHVAQETLAQLVKLHIDLLLRPSDRSFESTLDLRYKAISSILASQNASSPSLYEGNCVSMHLVSLMNSLENVSADKDLSSIDLYHESEIGQVTLCSSLLLNLERQVDSMLQEFTDHPTLVKISLVTKRILSFDARAPLMKYLTGLELLLEVMQDWDKNYAHRAIKLTEHVTALTQIIIKWRKLELNQWAHCLDHVLQKVQIDDQIHWWFQLFNLLRNFESCDKKELICSLRQLITKSSIATFEVRLNLLNTFSQQTLLIEGEKSSKFTLLDNIFKFYLQCKPSLDEKLNDERKTIDREVKQFVSVMRWTDMNYYSLRETIHKSHRSLVRFMKKFERCVNQPSASHMKLPSNSDSSSISSEDLVTVFDRAIATAPRYSFPPPEQNVDEHDLPLLFSKMTSFTKQISQVFNMIKRKISINEESTAELIDRMIQLQKLSVDSNITDKDEYTKEAHHIGNIKRKALSDLFKFLTESGFKWSLGSKYFSSCNINHLLATVTPVKSAFQQIDLLTDKYYYSCLLRFEKLKESLLNPSKDLNASVLSRVTGFAGFFMSTLVDQRQQLSSLTSLHQAFLAVLEMPQEALMSRDKEIEVRQFLIQSELLLTKIQLFVNKCSTYGDGVMNKEINTEMEKCNLAIKSLLLSSPASVSECEAALIVCSSSLEKLLTDLGPYHNHITREVLHLLEQIKPLQKNWSPQPADSVDHFSSFLQPLLKSIEKLVKYTQEHPIDEESSLINSSKLKQYLSLIDINRLTSYINSLQENNSTCPPSLRSFAERFCTLLTNMMNSYACAHYSLAKLFHILLNLFNDLATRGLCLPGELDDGKNSTGEGVEKDGIGLDEKGQGRKDVSDRITSQDELEGLMKENDDSQEPQDIDEEENAVDFDGKEYDKPSKSGDENDDQDESDSDAEEKMGNDVNDDDDVLDNKLWQDDDENDNQDEIDKEADETGKGEEFGEDKIVAKDDTLGNRGQEEEEEKSKKDDKDATINEKTDMDDEYEGENIDPYKSEPARENNLDNDEPVDLGDINLEQDDASGESDEDKDDDDENASSVDDENTADKMDQDAPLSDSEFQDDSEKVDHQLAPEDDAIMSDEDEQKTGDRLQDDLDSHNDDKAQVVRDSKSNNQQNVQSVECDDNDAMNNADEESPDQRSEQGDSKANGSDESGAKTDHHQFASGSSDQQNQRSSATQEKSVSQNRSESKKKRNILEHSALSRDDNKNNQDKQSSEMFKHIADDEKSDDEVMDTAVDDEDAKATRAIGQESTEEQEDIVMDEQEEQEQEKSNRNKYAEKVGAKSKKEKTGPVSGTDEMKQVDLDKEDDPFISSNHDVQRAGETTCHTNTDILMQTCPVDNATETTDCSMNIVDTTDITSESRKQAESLWSQCSQQVDSLVFELCQQLQLVLEPAKCAKLKGDYRTGKRINMRKVIAFIASQFRKDKIWLRRTKPSKRTYQIVLAVDDSGSMLENQCKIAAIQSLALLSRSLSLIEAGQLAVVRFGEEPVLVHKLEQQFTESHGPRILESFAFKQDKTNIAALVRQVSSLFNSTRSLHSSSIDFNQLMIVISDGRGIFNEGKSTVQTAVREMIDRGIFCVFLLIDNPSNQQSIFDIESFSFEDGKLIRSSYMDDFPFPFYLVVRNINTLPCILGESLRQWFQLVTQDK